MLTTRLNERRDTTSVRARLVLFDGTPLSAADACGLDEHEINHDLLLRNGVKALNLQTAGFGPTMLKARGAQSADALRQLGFDALHLCDADFCHEASMAYGASAVVEAFLNSAADAVALAGSEAMHMLDVTPPQLLHCCAGFPAEAVAVLQQLPLGSSLKGVSATTLLDAGLRAETLRSVGYGLANVVAQVAPSGAELEKFGYRI